MTIKKDDRIYKALKQSGYTPSKLRGYVKGGIKVSELLTPKDLEDGVDVADPRQNNVWVLTTPHSYMTWVKGRHPDGLKYPLGRSGYYAKVVNTVFALIL